MEPLINIVDNIISVLNEEKRAVKKMKSRLSLAMLLQIASEGEEKEIPLENLIETNKQYLKHSSKKDD